MKALLLAEEWRIMGLFLNRVSLFNPFITYLMLQGLQRCSTFAYIGNALASVLVEQVGQGEVCGYHPSWMTEHGGLTVEGFCSALGDPFLSLFVLRLLSLIYSR